MLALEQVILAHTALGTQIFGESAGKPCYVRLRSIDLGDVIEDLGPSSLQDAFTSYLARPFKIECDKPLWRVGVLDDGTIIFAYHHVIADGQSGLSFHKALLKALNALPNPLPDPQTVVTLPQNVTLPLAVENLTDVSVPFWKLCHEVYQLFAPASWKAGFDSWTGNTVISQPTTRTNIRLWQLSPSDSAKLLSLCRAHGCTLTAFIHALSVEVWSRILAVHRPVVLEMFKTLSTGVAVSLRHLSGTSPHEICDQSSKFHRYLPISLAPAGFDTSTPSTFGAFPWEKASTFAVTLHTQLGTVRQEIGAMWYLFGHFCGYFRGQLGKKREATFTISNVGPFPVAKGETDAATAEWSIGSMFFGQCDATCGAAIKINIVGSPDGSIGTSFTWGEGALDDELAEAFARMSEAWTSFIVASS